MEVGPDTTLQLPNRGAAGRQLGERLRSLRASGPVVLAIPRGGVPVGFEVSRVLAADFDVIVSLELTVPEDPRRALGAVAEFGGRAFSTDRVESSEHSFGDLDTEVDRVAREVARRAHIYRGDRPSPPLEGRTVVVVVDGVVDPMITRAALHGVWSRSPRGVVFGTGVMSRRSGIDIRRDAVDAVTLREPEFVDSMAEWYRECPSVTDAAIREMLGAATLSLVH